MRKNNGSKKTVIRAKIPIMYMKEGDIYVCFTPALNLVSHGDTFEEAERNFAKSLKLFIREVTRMGTWEEVLSECGWRKINNRLTPPTILRERLQQIQIPVTA
ncbi:MAG: hypothetical protein HQL11_02540 [Candidatus Omnitrophica bacterium]|nr:hypothetical protein [Candidatus Omnitrophota bacterium]